MSRRQTPALTLVGPPRRLILALALTFAFAAGIGGQSARAQGLAELNLIPVVVSPTTVAIPPSGASFEVTVDILASTFDLVPDAALQLVGQEFNSASETLLGASDWQCSGFVAAGNTGACTVTLNAAGGAASTDEKHWVIIADSTQGIGGTTGPVTVTYSDEPSYDPGPDGTVSWSQPSGTVGVDITTEIGGTVSVSGSPSGGASEYVLLGQTIDITTGGGACSLANPCTLVFRLDATEAANQGVTPLNAIVLRNGSAVPDCGTPRCVSERGRFGNDDIRLVVLADQVSEWNLARQPRIGDCKQGGWRDLTNASGRPFGNQGACVSYIDRQD